MGKFLEVLIGTIGLLLLIASFIYFLQPARSLPVFFPGHDVVIVTHHYKHGIGAFLLALLCFSFVWFSGGKDQPSKKTEDTTPPTTTQ